MFQLNNEILFFILVNFVYFCSMENKRGTRLQSSVPKKGMEYICIYYDHKDKYSNFVVGRVYRVHKIKKKSGSDELSNNDYVYLKHENDGLGGFPIRNSDMVYLENGVKIAYFDLYFRSVKEIRRDKLRKISGSRL